MNTLFRFSLWILGPGILLYFFPRWWLYIAGTALAILIIHCIRIIRRNAAEEKVFRTRLLSWTGQHFEGPFGAEHDSPLRDPELEKHLEYEEWRLGLLQSVFAFAAVFSILCVFVVGFFGYAGVIYWGVLMFVVSLAFLLVRGVMRKRQEGILMAMERLRDDAFRNRPALKLDDPASRERFGRRFNSRLEARGGCMIADFLKSPVEIYPDDAFAIVAGRTYPACLRALRLSPMSGDCSVAQAAQAALSGCSMQIFPEDLPEVDSYCEPPPLSPELQKNCDLYHAGKCRKINGEAYPDELSRRPPLELSEFCRYWNGREQAAIALTVRNIMIEQLGLPPDSMIHANDPMFLLNYISDGFDVVELVMGWEEAFGMDIPDADAEKLITFKDVVEYIQKRKDALCSKN